MPSAKSIGQSTRSEPGFDCLDANGQPIGDSYYCDSLEQVRQLVDNAKTLLDSLTALHFARLRIANLDDQYRIATSSMAVLASQAAEVQRRLLKTQSDLLDTRQRLQLEIRKKRNRSIENWLWRLAAGYLAYRQISSFR